jgi:ribose transport system ATP-binding protein
VVKKAAMVAKTREVLSFLHSDISPYDIVAHLGSGEQKTVEIARAFIQESKIMVLDEPTASFSKKETDHLLGIIRKLAGEGISIIYISHHLDEVFKIADRVTVIRDGQKINTYNIENLTEQQLIKDMVGRDVSAVYQRERTEIGDVIYEATNVSGNGVKQASLNVRAGELLESRDGGLGPYGTGGIALRRGAMEKGEIKIRGKKVRSNAAGRHREPDVLITEDRHPPAVPDPFIVKNTVIASYAKRKCRLRYPPTISNWPKSMSRR